MKRQKLQRLWEETKGLVKILLAFNLTVLNVFTVLPEAKSHMPESAAFQIIGLCLVIASLIFTWWGCYDEWQAAARRERERRHIRR